jgi:6-phosphofructokinase
VPKTMDNDVFGTEYCIGFSTAVTRSVNFIHDLRTAAGSHERFLIVELFGRYCGETCLLSSYLAGTDRALIAEVPFEPGLAVELLAADKRSNPSNYAVVAISEGAYPVGGQPVDADVMGKRELGGIGRLLRQELQRTTGNRVIYQRLGYLMRSGPPDALDRLVASNFASLAADLALAGETGRLVAILEGRYSTRPIATVRAGNKQVDVERFYDCVNYRPKIVGVLDLPMFLH